MASTTFTDNVTVIVSAWLNDVNTLTYKGFSNYTSIATSLSYSDTGILGGLASNTAGYNQLIVQNTNGGATSSSNLNISNDLATATTNYGEFGINSSGFTGTGSFSQAGNVYLASASSDLVVGTYSAKSIRFVVNSGALDAAVITPTGSLGIGGTPNTNALLDVQSTTQGVKFPSMTTTQKNAIANTAGLVVYDATLNQLTVNNGSAWGSIGGGATGGGTDSIFQLNSIVMTTSYTLPTGKNASLVGPLTINTGVVLTVPSGQRLVVL